MPDTVLRGVWASQGAGGPVAMSSRPLAQMREGGPRKKELAEVTQGGDGGAKGMSHFDIHIEVVAWVALTALGPGLNKTQCDTRVHLGVSAGRFRGGRPN